MLYLSSKAAPFVLLLSILFLTIKSVNLSNLDITQQQVADYLHIKQNTYSQYEVGALRYPVDALITLADFYNVSVDYLLGRTDVKTPYPKK